MRIFFMSGHGGLLFATVYGTDHVSSHHRTMCSYHGNCYETKVVARYFPAQRTKSASRGNSGSAAGMQGLVAAGLQACKCLGRRVQPAPIPIPPSQDAENTTKFTNNAIPYRRTAVPVPIGFRGARELSLDLIRPEADDSFLILRFGTRLHHNTPHEMHFQMRAGNPPRSIPSIAPSRSRGAPGRASGTPKLP